MAVSLDIWNAELLDRQLRDFRWIENTSLRDLNDLPRDDFADGIVSVDEVQAPQCPFVRHIEAPHLFRHRRSVFEQPLDRLATAPATGDTLG